MEIQWALVIFTLFVGCGGGLFAFIGLAELLGAAKKTCFPAAIISLVLVLVGGCASVFHLQQPGRIMGAAANLFSFSGISVEIIALSITAILLVVYLFVAKRSGSAGGLKVVGILGIIFGILLAFVTGNSYVFAAQPNWNTLLLPLGYLASGLTMGGLLFVALMAIKGEEAGEIKKIALFAVIAVALQLVFFVAYGAFLGFAEAALYWGGAIAVGTVLAAICAIMVYTKAEKAKALAWAGFACAFIGGLCFRILMWLVGTGLFSFFADAAQFKVF